MSLLLNIERLLVSVASCAAIFPIWQYVSEAPDRKLTSDATVVIAVSTCEGSGAMDFVRATGRAWEMDVNSSRYISKLRQEIENGFDAEDLRSHTASLSTTQRELIGYFEEQNFTPGYVLRCASISASHSQQPT